MDSYSWTQIYSPCIDELLYNLFTCGSSYCWRVLYYFNQLKHRISADVKKKQNDFLHSSCIIFWGTPWHKLNLKIIPSLNIFSKFWSLETAHFWIVLQSILFNPFSSTFDTVAWDWNRTFVRLPFVSCSRKPQRQLFCKWETSRTDLRKADETFHSQ